MYETIEGTATDDDEIEKVEISTDRENWSRIPGTTSWIGNLTLKTGNNTIYVKVTDVSGNYQERNVTVIIQLPKNDDDDEKGVPGFSIILIFVSISILLVFIHNSKKRKEKTR